MAVELGLIDKSGAWYSYNGDKIGQGRENVKQFLRDNFELCEQLEVEIRKHYGIDKVNKEVTSE